MRYFLLCLAMLGSLPLTAQTPGRKAARDLSEKLAPRFTNDNNSFGTTYLFAETDPAGYDLLVAAVSFSDKNQTQKIGFSPLRLSKQYRFLLSNLKLNFTHSGGALTGGLSIGNDNSAFECQRVQTLFENIYTATPDNALPVARIRRADESLKEYMAWYNQTPEMKAFQDALLAKFDQQRLAHVFKYSAGYNIQFFPVLGSSSAAGNFDSLNYHAVKSNNYFGKGSYSHQNGLLNITAAYNYFNKRKSADSTQQKRRYTGYSIGFTVRAIPLLKKENLIKKDFYKNSLFIPGIYLGINYDRQDYKGAEAIFAEDKLEWKTVVTISIDFAISPASQFRLAFPIQRTKEYSIVGKQVNTIALLQYSFKLINLADN